ncbi:MAG: hypothetical protein IJ837_01415 [Clostridia bacterium]|nr:hypothetical protein [Clostridia bacterium]
MPEGTERRQRLKNFFERIRNAESVDNFLARVRRAKNIEPIEETDLIAVDEQREDKDKKAKRRGLGWLIALGVLAAAATITFPAVFIFATKFATLPLIGLLIGTAAIGLDVGFFASIRLSRRRRKERKAIKAFAKCVTSEKSRNLVKDNKFLIDRYIEQNSSNLTEEQTNENRRKFETSNDFVEYDGNACEESDRARLSTARTNAVRDLTRDERLLLLKCARVKEDEVKNKSGDGYIRFEKPYVINSITFKNGENTETIDLKGYKIYSYQGLKMYEKLLSELCSTSSNDSNKIEATLNYEDQGVNRKESRKYAKLNEDKVQKAEQALARSI